MANVTRTTNRIHFEDLDPMRFEDLILNLLHRWSRFSSIEHVGRLGSDSGADMQATEVDENGSMVNWVVQCKRYRTFAAADARKLVGALDTSANMLLVVVACDVSLRSRDTLRRSAREKGFTDVQVWAASDIEARLYESAPDLLNVYFGFTAAGTRYHAPHPADLILWREYRALVRHGSTLFLASHDFGNPLSYLELSPFTQMSETWIGVRREFQDEDVQGLFADVIVKNRRFVDTTVERLFPMDHVAEALTCKTDLDKRNGLTATTRKAIRAMNDAAHELHRAIDVFERLAMKKLRVS